MPTDSELKAAAERLRSIVPDERMWDEPAAQWSDIDKDLWVCAFGFVRHILAQRADDGELIDAAFLESLGFIKCCTSRANPALDAQGFEDWTITYASGEDPRVGDVVHAAHGAPVLYPNHVFGADGSVVDHVDKNGRIWLNEVQGIWEARLLRLLRRRAEPTEKVTAHERA